LARLSEELKELLVPRLTALFNEESKEKLEQKSSMSLNPAPQKQFPTVIWEVFQPKVVVIGSSTGGPTALEKIFSSIQGPVRCPILIVQHMPPVFTATLAERLGKISNIPAGEAKHLEILQNNRIYVAPGNFHMLLSLHGNDVRFILDQGPTLNFVRPSVDLLFSSAAKIYQNKCFGIILTGMGEDGKMGANEVKRMGGCVMIQNKESSVVFGMPGAVFSSGAFDKMGDLNEISSTLQEKMTA
jgi:two-component system chemotaxis response regulator CheB